MITWLTVGILIGVWAGIMIMCLMHLAKNNTRDLRRDADDDEYLGREVSGPERAGSSDHLFPSEIKRD